MPKHAQARIRQWQVTLILTLFFVAVAGAAAIGWWYARESPPHQGPIVLISVDGLPASKLATAGVTRASDPGETPADRAVPSLTPGIDALAADAVVFERAYSQATGMLPALASAFSGQLPFEHRVRDDAGYTLDAETRTLAELLRNRGFSTGAAVSSVLLRQDTGFAQGFSFFMEPPPMNVPAALYGEPATRRSEPTDSDNDDPLALAIDAATAQAATQALDAAEAWALSQRGQRYFLFVQVDAEHAEAAVTRISRLLRQRRLYDDATIVLAGDRGRAGLNPGLDEETLRVPLLIKQPAREGALRRVGTPVQQIDLLPTILDLVRAPIPGNLRGRSLRSILTDDDGRIAPQPIYSESLAAHFRFGGYPVYALTMNDSRYIRGGSEELVRLDAPGTDAATSAPATLDVGENSSNEQSEDEGEAPDDIAPLRATLDRLLSTRPIEPPEPAAEADQDRLALTGYLVGIASISGTSDVGLLGRMEQQSIATAHYGAARLVGWRRLPSAIRALQGIVREHPTLAVVHYQIGVLLAEMGRTRESVASFHAAAALRPDAVEIPRALAAALVRAKNTDDARIQAESRGRTRPTSRATSRRGRARGCRPSGARAERSGGGPPPRGRRPGGGADDSHAPLRRGYVARRCGQVRSGGSRSAGGGRNAPPA